MELTFPKRYLQNAWSILVNLPKTCPDISDISMIQPGIIRLVNENGENWDFALVQAVSKVIAYEHNMSMRKFKKNFLTHIHSGCTALRENKVDDRIEIVFQQTPKKAMKQGYYLSILPKCRNQLVKSIMDHLTLNGDTYDFYALREQLMGIDEQKFPLGFYYEDFIGVWSVSSMLDDNGILIDDRFVSNSTVDLSKSLLVTKYLSFLSFREFEVIVRVELLLNDDKSGYVFTIIGSSVTELSMTEFGLKSLLSSVFRWLEIPARRLPSIEDDFFLVRVSPELLIVFSPDADLKEFVVDRLLNLIENDTEDKFRFEKSRFATDSLFVSMSLSNMDYCDLNIKISELK